MKDRKKIAVVAFGGNALLPEKQTGTFIQQQLNADLFCEAILDIVQNGYELIIVHGNGPQVGNILVQVEEDKATMIPGLPLDACVAATQGTIGYILINALRQACKRRKINKNVVAILTTVIVSLADAAFKHPEKPIGAFLTQERAIEMMKNKDWHIVEDSGRGYRRVVPSPKPKRILESGSIRKLVFDNNIVVAGGGGGIPVENKTGGLKGVEAVVDKDLVASLLAREVGADIFIIVTGVPKVAINFGKPDMRYLDTVTVREAERYMEEGHFPPGSMGPKMEAALQFIKHGGKEVLITSADEIKEALEQKTGTHIVA